LEGLEWSAVQVVPIPELANSLNIINPDAAAII
jgi:hypothetical protein